MNSGDVPDNDAAQPRVGVGVLLVDTQGRVLAGEARNCEPEKTRAVRWFRFDELPQKLTRTAKNAFEAYRRRLGFYSPAAGAS
jgi:hypothetical protein